jgi:hypothetical protein
MAAGLGRCQHSSALQSRRHVPTIHRPDGKPHVHEQERAHAIVLSFFLAHLQTGTLSKIIASDKKYAKGSLLCRGGPWLDRLLRFRIFQNDAAEILLKFKNPNLKRSSWVKMTDQLDIGKAPQTKCEEIA